MNESYEFIVYPDLLLLVTIHDLLFTDFDFVDEAKKRFAVKGIQVPILTDHVSPVLHIVLHGLRAVQLLFQFFQFRCFLIAL